MRVLFVSDTHLGLDLPERPRVARRRRGDDFFDNFERALAPALRGDVDVVVHGGDLLYCSRVPLWLADRALAPLRRIAEAGLPVLLIPGNHERARMPYPLLAMHERLHVFDRPRNIVLTARGVRVAFVGFPYTSGVRERFREQFAAATADLPATDIRVLCLHQCVEGATCGPGNFTFRFGSDVIRLADLPRDLAVTLCGHIHRHQVLRPDGHAPIVYAGSTERTSFAEASETKGTVIVELASSGVEQLEFKALPTRPMVTCAIKIDQGSPSATSDARIAAAIAATPADAVVQLRIDGEIPQTLSAARLGALAGERTVTLAGRWFNTRSSGWRKERFANRHRTGSD